MEISGIFTPFRTSFEASLRGASLLKEDRFFNRGGIIFGFENFAVIIIPGLIFEGRFFGRKGGPRGHFWGWEERLMTIRERICSRSSSKKGRPCRNRGPLGGSKRWPI